MSLFDKGRLLESEMNGMAIFVYPTDECAASITLLNAAENAYNEWMSEADEVGDTPICDWIIERLKETEYRDYGYNKKCKGFEYGRDYRIFTDLNWD